MDTMTIKNYISAYGKYKIDEKPLNEIDYCIFSILSYLNFQDIIPKYKKGTITLEKACDLYFKRVDKKLLKANIYAVKDTASIFEELKKTKRYKDLELFNYSYKVTFDMQFGALSIKLPNNTIFISFEGTDGYISGWYEDFQMSYKFPTLAQKEAIKYINKVTNFFTKNVIVGGHSKGGNLALTSSMYAKRRVRRKIKEIYSFDGPGLRRKELNSNKYKKIENKYKHYVPYQSIIGMLFFNNDNFIVIDSNTKYLFQHRAITWLIEDNKFKRCELSSSSKKFRKALDNWLDKLDDKGKEKFTLVLFGILNKAGINDLIEFKKSMIPNILKIIIESTSLAKEDRKMLYTCFNDLYKEWKG